MKIEELELFQFVKKKSFVDDVDINMETKLEDDLGIYGNDAVEFIVDYGKYYNVDVSKFMSKEYFSAEGAGVLSFLMAKAFGGKEKRKVFTVGHLYKGILSGRLDENVINS